MASILVCDDTRSICELLEIALRKDNLRVETVTSGEAAKKKLDSALYDVVITDIKMPNTDGIEVLRHARRASPDSAVILITAVEDYEAAVQAVNAGAFQYIHKGPGLVEEVRVAVGRALENLALRRQNFALRRDAASRNSLDNMIGNSPAIQRLKQVIRTVAATSSTVLVQGESGTGKELAAREIHNASARARFPFLPLNCAALAESLLFSDLFGHVRGAFTGADRDRAGVFEAARGGTVLLDEIGDLPLAAQGLLLRVVQESEVRRLGESSPRRVDVRVLAATHHDLERSVAAGMFREDLYYRLKVGAVELPPLRERADDLLELADLFLARQPFSPAPRLSAAARERLRRHAWPGNIRELENVLRLAAALAAGGVIEPAHLELPDAAAVTGAAGGAPVADVAAPAAAPYHQQVESLRRRLLGEAIAAAGGNHAEAARRLGISRQALSYLVRQLGLR